MRTDWTSQHQNVFPSAHSSQTRDLRSCGSVVLRHRSSVRIWIVLSLRLKPWRNYRTWCGPIRMCSHFQRMLFRLTWRTQGWQSSPSSISLVRHPLPFCDTHRLIIVFLNRMSGLIQNSEADVINLIRESVECHIRSQNTVILVTIPMSGGFDPIISLLCNQLIPNQTTSRTSKRCVLRKRLTLSESEPSVCVKSALLRI